MCIRLMRGRNCIMSEFKSIIKDELNDLIALKRAKGLKYEVEFNVFLRIDKFLIENNCSNKALTKEICDKWCAKRTWETINNRNHRVSSLRIITTYLNEIGIKSYVPPKGIYKKGNRYEAHIYTDDEIQRFFKAVDLSKSVPSECPYRSLIMPVFFRILYTSGMRVSELRLLRVKDMHEDECYLVVKNSKNNKDRLIPIHSNLAKKCSEIRKAIHKDSNEDEYFFMLYPGREMTNGNLYKNFRRYLNIAGISHTGKGPRIHDFRHTYCVNIIKTWILDEKPLLNNMEYLRVMLGHETYKETAYYIKLTESLFPTLVSKLKNKLGDIIIEQEVDNDEYY